MMLCCQGLTGEDVGVSVLRPVDGQVCCIMGKIQTDALQLLKHINICQTPEDLEAVGMINASFHI